MGMWRWPDYLFQVAESQIGNPVKTGEIFNLGPSDGVKGGPKPSLLGYPFQIPVPGFCGTEK